MASPVPVDDTITLADLDRDPYPIYRRLRARAPVLRVEATGRIFLTRAEETRAVKDDPETFSSDDPNTPMKRAFWAHTLMRKDGAAHRRERMAMMAAYAPHVIRDHWMPQYERAAKGYVAALPRGETVDLFPALAGPYAARGLAILLGLDEGGDDEMQRWSQALIDGAGNFGWRDEPFARADAANEEMHALFDRLEARHLAQPNPSAFSVMLNAREPIEKTQMHANLKIAIGGGINEPRDAFNTILFGLLTHPDQLAQVRRDDDWERAFEEGVRWVAPIQASSRRATRDTEIAGHAIAEGETVMTIQASACRDERIYGDGEAFEVYRDPAPHQAFGNGPHFCMGAKVARQAVANVLLPILFDRFPKMRLPEPDAVVWRGFGFRGPLNMPVLLQ